METTAQISYKLPVFEGPLDLLLTLIAKNKIEITDIIITDLLEQYMEQIKQIRSRMTDASYMNANLFTKQRNTHMKSTPIREL